MLKGTWDLLFFEGVGDDVFGETYTARIAGQDPENKYLLINMLREYIMWYEQNARFYDGYLQDKQKL